MAYEFKTLGSVEALTKVPENANALVEVDGEIKRVPGGALGGNNEYDLVITDDSYNRNASVDAGSYQNVYNKIMVKKDVPKILIKYCHDYVDAAYGVTTSFIYANIIVDVDNGEHYLEICYDHWVSSAYNEHSYIALYPNGEIYTSWAVPD